MVAGARFEGECWPLCAAPAAQKEDGMSVAVVVSLIVPVLLLAMSLHALGSEPVKGADAEQKRNIEPAMNLLSNPGFEEGPEGWSLPDGVMSIDGTVSHSGSASLRVSWDDAAKRQVAVQSVAVKPGRRYLISAWLKCSDVRGSQRGATFGLEWPGRGASPVGVSGTTDWTRVRFYTSVVPENAGSANLFVTLDWGASGTAWIDDICVVEVDPRPLVTLRLDSAVVVGEKDSAPFTVHTEDVAVEEFGEDEAIDVRLCSPPWNAPLATLALQPGVQTSASFPTSDLNEGVYKITCDVVEKNTGRALCDQQSLTAYKRPPMQCLLTPHSRIVLPGSDAPSVQLTPYRGGTLTGEVVDGGGKELERIPSRTVTAGHDDHIQLAGGYPPGRYGARLRLSTDGQPAYSCELPFAVVDESEVKRGVVIGPDNLLLDRGKPWFPMFVYVDTAWDPARQQEMDRRDPRLAADLLGRLEGTPFGVLDYATPIGGLDDTVAFADECAKRGIRLALSIKDMYPGSSFHEVRAKAFPGKTSEEVVRLLIGRLRSHPALALYYINDELGTQFYPALRAMRQWVYEEDPLHPTLQVHYDLECIRELAPSYDIFGPELYPWPDSYLRKMAEWSDIVTSQLPGTAPFWGCLWHFKNEPMGSQKLRALAYLAIAKGARGLLFYSYNDLLLDADFEKRWADLVDLGKEIEARLPILLQPEPQVRCEADSPAVVLRTVSGDRGTWLLAVNAGGERVVPAITTGEGIRSAAHDGESLPLADGRIRVTLDPFEVKLIGLGAEQRGKSMPPPTSPQ